MKIAILTPTFSHFSGIDRVVEQQVKKLINHGHYVTIIALEAKLSVKGAEVKIIGMPRNLFLQRLYRLFFFFDMFKINQTANFLNGYDMVISHQYPMNLIAKKAKSLFAITFHAYNSGVAPPETFIKWSERLYIRLFTFLTNRSFRAADKIISISKYLQRVLLHETGLQSIVTEELFRVDSVRFNRSVDGHSVRKQYNINNAPCILYVGRISPHKGIHLLIKAFKKVRRTCPRAILYIIGKPTFDEYLRQLKAIADKNVIFTGFIDDEKLPDYYAACNVYATASLWEGFDLPIIEAQAYGKPVVAFDLCSHPEVINKKGVLVPPGDINKFAQALVEKLKQ